MSDRKRRQSELEAPILFPENKPARFSSQDYNGDSRDGGQKNLEHHFKTYENPLNNFEVSKERNWGQQSNLP